MSFCLHTVIGLEMVSAQTRGICVWLEMTLDRHMAVFACWCSGLGVIGWEYPSSCESGGGLPMHDGFGSVVWKILCKVGMSVQRGIGIKMSMIIVTAIECSFTVHVDKG